MKNNEDSSDVTYYPWFDWLRAICACTVMFYHDHVFKWVHAGDFAVQVFFALSGWLIGGMLLRTPPSAMLKFYFNRAIRIWIPYYLAILILLCVSLMREPITAKWIEIVLYKLSFVYNLFGTRQLTEYATAMPQHATLNHLWSVNAEEQFYLLAPLLLVYLNRNIGRTPLFWIGISLIALVLDTYSAIIIGVTAAVIVYKWGNIHLTFKGRLFCCLLLSLCVTALIFDINYLIFAPFTGITIVLILAVPGKKSFFGSLFGGMSYPLYLNHWIGVFTLNFLMSNMRDTIARHFLSAVANILFAMLMYWFIDRNLLSRRSEWYTLRRGAIITFSAYLMILIGISFGLRMFAK